MDNYLHFWKNMSRILQHTVSRNISNDKMLFITNKEK